MARRRFAGYIRDFAARFAKYGFRPEAMAPVYGLAENAVGLAFPPLGRAPDHRSHRSCRAHARRARLARRHLTIRTALEFVACGRPLPGHEIRIVGRDRRARRTGGGAAAISWSLGHTGYFDNPAKNRELLTVNGSTAAISPISRAATSTSRAVPRTSSSAPAATSIPRRSRQRSGEVPGMRKGCVAVFGSQDPRRGTERVIVLAETRETEAASLAALRQRVEEAVTPLLDAAPDEVVSGSASYGSQDIERKAAPRIRSRAVRAGALARPQPLWRQMLRFGLAG